MKRFLPLVGLCLALSIPLSGAYALSMAGKSNSLGGACTKVGAKATIGSNSATCTKVGKKLIWQKSKVLTPKVTPTPTPSKTATPTPTPTKSASTPALPTSQSEYEINVNAKTWNWSFAYFLAGVKEPRNGANATLFIPQGKAINLNLLSSDTSHGFWVPGLSLAKEVDAGARGTLKFTANNLGKFPGMCNIECGRGHSGMTFTVEVISEADYLKFLTTLKAA